MDEFVQLQEDILRLILGLIALGAFSCLLLIAADSGGK